MAPAASFSTVVLGPFPPLRGGIAHFNTRLVATLARHREVYPLSFSRQYPKLLFPGRTQIEARQPLPDELRASASIDSMNPSSWLGVGFRVRRLRAYSALFAHYNPWLDPAYGTIARCLDPRVTRRILLCHNLWPHEPRIIDRLLLRYTLSTMDGVLTFSTHVAREVRELVPQLAVEVARLPVADVFSSPPPGARSNNRKHWGVDDDTLVLLVFGHIRAYKGLEIALQALSLLQQQHHKIHLVVAGEFYEGHERAQRTVASLGLLPCVTIIDQYIPEAEVPGLFAGADACLLPYLDATQSGVVKVAYRYGLPVLVSRVGGVAEDVIDGETGFVFAPGDPRAVAEAVLRFEQTRATVDFGAHITQHRSRFDWGQVHEALLRLEARSP